MGRLTAGAGNAFGDFMARLIWDARQNLAALSRSLDVWSGLMLGALCLVVSMAVVLEQQQRQAESWEARYRTAQRVKPQVRSPVETPDDGRQRLHKFEQLLLPHPDIPQAVQDMLGAAEDAGLSIRAAEYRVQTEDRGGFMRYRINLPVQGTAEAVNRYIYAALLHQKNLALENVQLKRDNLDSPNLEARIQWVLLTRLPPPTDTQRPKP
jgi:DNA primase